MPLFRRGSQNEQQVKLERSGSGMQKQRSADVHDPILTAVQEAQPFEISTQQNTIAISPSGAHRDIFGNTINNPDRSNPARLRDERPLDTIRSFEYACTGDDRIRDEMETARLGWNPRQGFSSMPQFETNPYARNNENVIAFDSSKQPQQYTRPIIADPDAGDNKKKKRGLFGKKKK